MNNLETVQDTSSVKDTLISKQKEGVARMRTSLLAFDDNGQVSRKAIQSITNLRIYHQLTRIVRYTEMADKLENKLYECIDNSIDNLDDDSPATWLALLEVQGRLQKLMLDSHKLLQPYLDLQEFSISDLSSSQDETNSTLILNSASRDKLRLTAQNVLKALENSDDK